MEKQHRCGRCRESFGDSCDLAKHMRTHETPYSCPHCGQGFNWSSDLSEHIQGSCLHLQGRPHRCPECGFGFRSKLLLNRHLESSHPERARARGQVRQRPGPHPAAPSSPGQQLSRWVESLNNFLAKQDESSHQQQLPGRSPLRTPAAWNGNPPTLHAPQNKSGVRNQAKSGDVSLLRTPPAKNGGWSTQRTSTPRYGQLSLSLSPLVKNPLQPNTCTPAKNAEVSSFWSPQTKGGEVSSVCTPPAKNVGWPTQHSPIPRNGQLSLSPSPLLKNALTPNICAPAKNGGVSSPASGVVMLRTPLVKSGEKLVHTSPANLGVRPLPYVATSQQQHSPIGKDCVNLLPQLSLRKEQSHPTTVKTTADIPLSERIPAPHVHAVKQRVHFPSQIHSESNEGIIGSALASYDAVRLDTTCAPGKPLVMPKHGGDSSRTVDVMAGDLATRYSHVIQPCRVVVTRLSLDPSSCTPPSPVPAPLSAECAEGDCAPTPMENPTPTSKPLDEDVPMPPLKLETDVGEESARFISVMKLVEESIGAGQTSPKTPPRAPEPAPDSCAECGKLCFPTPCFCKQIELAIRAEKCKEAASFEAKLYGEKLASFGGAINPLRPSLRKRGSFRARLQNLSDKINCATTDYLHSPMKREADDQSVFSYRCGECGLKCLGSLQLLYHLRLHIHQMVEY